MEKREIRTRAFVHAGVSGEEWVELDTLPEEARRRYAGQLLTAYMNALFTGRADFYPAGEGNAGERRSLPGRPQSE